MYLTIGGAEDGKLLQNYLDRLSVWEDRWDMEFNPSKCQVVRVTSSRNPFNFPYTLHFQVLEVVTSAKYLGWTFHASPVANPGIPTSTGYQKMPLTFIQRNLRTKNQKVRETAYNTLVRPNWSTLPLLGTHILRKKYFSSKKCSAEQHAGPPVALTTGQVQLKL